MSRGIVRQIDQIVAGAKGVARGVLGLIGVTDELLLDLKFWAASRDWDYPLGPIYGEKGTVTTVCAFPQAFFRVEKMMLTDSAEKTGHGTSVTQILVGQRLQRTCTGGGTLSIFYSANALGNGLKWDVCHPAMTIAISISFIESCTWYGNLFGKAVI